MIQAAYLPYTFVFNFAGGTSRGVLHTKPSFILKIWVNEKPELAGYGEVSILPDLSPEQPDEAELVIKKFIENPFRFLENNSLAEYPAVKFGIETAFIDLKNKGNRILFPSEFTSGKKGIKINGLIWMGEKNLMLERLKEKVNQGFTCIKIKVGAINFDDELSLLKYIRKSFSPIDLEIRLDANGAFNPKNVFEKLDILSGYGIHSIEQPIKQKQLNEMAKLCKNTPIPVALDEELIGMHSLTEKISLLETINPQFLVLKPSLIGGFEQTDEWSNLAKKMNVGWWVTSALEGNIGLNAIAQWTFKNGSEMPQGLGTGKVFSNNIDSPLEIRGEQLWYNPNKKWQINF